MYCKEIKIKKRKDKPDIIEIDKKLPKSIAYEILMQDIKDNSDKIIINDLKSTLRLFPCEYDALVSMAFNGKTEWFKAKNSTFIRQLNKIKNYSIENRNEYFMAFLPMTWFIYSGNEENKGLFCRRFTEYSIAMSIYSQEIVEPKYKIRNITKKILNDSSIKEFLEIKNVYVTDKIIEKTAKNWGNFINKKTRYNITSLYASYKN